MISAYIRATKWYCREYAWHFKITLWPSWLARKLCNHSAAAQLRDPLRLELGVYFACPDCGKLVTVGIHGDVYDDFYAAPLEEPE